MAFLMRNSFVVQLYMYLFLQIPENIIEKTSGTHPRKANQDKQFVIANPSQPSEFEAECIQLLKESRHSPIVRDLFTRLLPYLNGKSHLDEIIYEENVTRKELKLVMSSFREEIITTLHG
ncbi:hypothetical protein HDU91_000944 [Kappamyces sp. JEL0680]|nr:hypothetical protein HDU91_000944 [Kappamyces sp. JEL0680]